MVSLFHSFATTLQLLLFTTTLFHLSTITDSFAIIPSLKQNQHHNHHNHYSHQLPKAIISMSSQTSKTATSATVEDTDEGTSLPPDPKSMRIKEIKSELKEMNVKSDDCFDKESLCDRLNDARNGIIKGASASASASASTTTSSGDDAQQDSSSSQEATTDPTPKSTFNKEQKSQELRSLRVKELRTKCAQFNIRWATMIEKEELVQALVQHYEKMGDFSPSGTLIPGKVTTITEDSILETEINSGTASTPLLLDVFATWCGPCKMMGPYLEEAAVELGDTVRVAKIDSDLHPEWSSRLNVKGLPSVIVFDGKTGKELQRVEGALMKNDLVNLARSHAT